jgi:hypothetical protein
MASRMLEDPCKVEDKEKVALEATSASYMAGTGWFGSPIVHDLVG